MRHFTRFLFVLAVLLQTVTTAPAGPAMPAPVDVSQPDGTKISTRIRGDEFRNWVELHETGHTIIHNKTTGFWEYAGQLPDGTLTNSGIKVEPKGVNAPAGIPKGLKPPRNKGAAQQMNLMLKEIYQQRLDSAKGALLPNGATAVAGDWTPGKISGERKLLLVLVGFVDRPFATLPANWNGAVFDSAAKSVAKYYLDNSFNSLKIVPAAHTQAAMPAGVVSVSLETNHPDTGGNYTFSSDQAWGNSALAQADNYVNFSSFDTNGDGILAPAELVIYFVVAGYEASCSNLTPSVWAHAWYTTGIGLTAGSKNVQRWAQNGEYFNLTTRMPMGVIAHELGHQMCGLPDLYDTSNNNEAMGAFSLMASGSWGADSDETSGVTPTLLDVWSREYLGWATPLTPITSTAVTLPLPLSANDAAVKLIRPDSSTTEYFLAENRHPAGWDLGLKTFLGSSWQGGMLLTHIDITSGTQGSNDINDYSETSVSPGHQGVVPVQASTAFCDMLTLGAACRGDATTLFHQNNNSDWGPSTKPNSAYYSGLATRMALNSISLPQSDMTAALDMNAPVNALCGASHNQGFTVTPTSNLCLVGAPSAVAGNGPWTWDCYGANGGTNANCTAYSNSQLVQLLTQNFDGVAAPALPGGWLSIPGAKSGGAWTTHAGTHYPAGIAAHSPINVVHFNAYDVAAGTTAQLASPAFSLSGKLAGKINFWLYKDSQYSNADKVEIYINQVNSLTKATLLGTVYRSTGNAPPVKTSGWYQYSFDIPASYAGGVNYLLLNGVGSYGNDIHLDDLWVTAFNDAAVNGSCGTANGTAVTSAPTDNLCASGTASTVSGSGPWEWTCSGQDGGTTASCSAQKVVPLLINNGAAYTTTAAVILKLAAPGGLTYVRFSNDGSKWSKWSTVSPTTLWKLASGDGLKTVSAQFAAAASAVSGDTFNATITLDTKVPTGTLKINSGALYSKSRTVNLTIAATDLTSGVSRLCTKESNLPCSDAEFEPFVSSKEQTIISPEDGKKTFYVTLKDLAGKISKPLKASIILDTTSPVGSVVINGGKPDTTTPLVSLSIKAVKAAAMQLSLDGGITWLAWEKFSGGKKVTLTGGTGIKTVKIKFRDLAGNESSVYEDSIELK